MSDEWIKYTGGWIWWLPETGLTYEKESVMSHKQTPPRIYWNGVNQTAPGARFIGGAWHSFDCMCPVCLQATMDEISAGLKTEEVKGCQCNTETDRHSHWCPLYTDPNVA